MSRDERPEPAATAQAGPPEGLPAELLPGSAPESAEDPAEAIDGPPLGSWGRMYALVLGALVAEIGLFYLFTVLFS